MTDVAERVIVDLGDLAGDRGCIIVEHPTGVWYTNQVGGYACLHPETEGYAIPIMVAFSFLDALFSRSKKGLRGHGYDGLTLKQAMFLERTFREYHKLFPYPLEVDMARRREAMEAWLPVLWEGKRAILTWENSD